MTSVERARKFIQARGKAIALTIVPLATLAIAASQPAKAAGLVFSSGGCAVVGMGVLSSAQGECLNTPIPGFQNGANSLKLSGTASVIASSGGGPGYLDFIATGSANQGSAGVLPLTWDFDVVTSQPIGSGSWFLSFSFNSGSFSRSVDGALAFESCGDSNCAHVSGSSQIGLDGSIYRYEIMLSVGGFFNQGTILQLTVPNNSIDVNPQVEVDAQAPEPASLALGATGLLGLMLARFRRRKV